MALISRDITKEDIEFFRSKVIAYEEPYISILDGICELALMTLLDETLEFDTPQIFVDEDDE